MASDLQKLIEELTAYPATEKPFLSLYLNLQPDGSNRREFLTTLRQDFDMIADSIKNRDGDLDSFEADRERIMTYLETEAPLEANAVAIFACHAEGVWFTVPLQAPVETQIIEDRFPHVFQLARLDDDYETYAVVLADAQESRIFVVTLNQPEKAAETEADEEIRRFEAGGWGQMLFQRRTENVIKAHMKEIDDKLRRLIKRYNIEHVIIAGNDSIKGAVLGVLSEEVKSKLVDYINLDITANMQQIMETIEPLMQQVEREQEADDLATLEEQVSTKGGRGVVGIEGTALALSKGQVRMLIMRDNFSALGSMSDDGFIMPGLRETNPYNGLPMQQVQLREAFIARAAQTGATVQIVAENPFLDQHEGVGALLWYNDEQPVNELLEEKSEAS